MKGHLFLKGYCLQIVLTLTVAVTAVMGYSSGAPDFACSTMTPSHPPNEATGPVPFSVNISSLDGGYVPGQTYTIVLSGSSTNANFRGFLIQGRTMTNTVTGTFVDNGDDQQTRCSNSAATHMNGNDKTMVELRWTAPPMGTGTISFRYAFVDIQTRYWPDQSTNTVTEASTSTCTVTFSQSTYIVNENDGSTQPVLVLTNSLSTNIIVQVRSIDVTATGGGIDYNSGPYNITISAGITRVTFNVSIINDDMLEDNEEFILFINNGSLPDNVITNSSSRATVIIRNDDVLVVEFTSGQFTGSESSGFIEVIVKITGGTSTTPITVTITPSVQSPVSAMESGVDFNSNPFTITINAGATESRANISVTCDDEVEGLETFNMTLTLTSNATGVTLGRDTSEGVITDSTVEVSFSQSSYGVMEDDGTVTLMIGLSQVSSVPFEVTVSTMDMTAVDGEDYSGGMIVVNVPAGVMIQSFTVVIVDDDTVECNETFIVTILSVTTCGVTIGNNNRSEVKITDDDSATVSLSQSQYSVAESDSSLTVNITLSRATSEDVMIEVTINNGSANAGEDYAVSTGLVFNVAISAGSTSSSFDVDISNDMILEDNETFNITIRLLPSCLSLSLGTSSSTATIIDNDDAMITFQSTSFSGTETSGVISATVVISGGIISSSDISVPVSFTVGTAVGNNNDFNSTTQTAIIAAGTSSSTVNITVVNDNIVERDEMFLMTLNVPTLPGIIAGAITKATGIIIDSTVIGVRFTQDRFTGSETIGFVLVNIELVRGTSANPFSVTVTPSQQTPAFAEGGVDFSTTPLTATFASRMTTSSVRVQVINDSIVEGSEEFNLALDIPSSLGPAIKAGDRGAAVGVIADSNVLVVEFTSGQFTGSESLGFIEVVVRITGGTSSNPITVTLTSSVQSPVSAMGSGVDFNSNPFTITINAGATEGRANISVTCDDEVERLETFDMTLTSNTSGVTLGRDTSEGVIIDNTVALPTCSHDICKSRKTILCIIANSTCLLKPQLGYCLAVYYSTEVRSVSDTCKECRDPTDPRCLKKWSRCIKKRDRAVHGSPRRWMKTVENFKIYRHPC